VLRTQVCVFKILRNISTKHEDRSTATRILIFNLPVLSNGTYSEDLQACVPQTWGKLRIPSYNMLNMTMYIYRHGMYFKTLSWYPTWRPPSPIHNHSTLTRGCVILVKLRTVRLNISSDRAFNSWLRRNVTVGQNSAPVPTAGKSIFDLWISE
jgi:hypothetical protein